MRFCNGCQEWKPLVAFGPEGKKPRHRCNPCLARQNREREHQNPEKRRRAYEKYYRHNRDQVRARQRRWREQNPEKIRAQSKVLTELEAGRLARGTACERCGRDKHLVAHHADYTKPLEVEWLCRRCHGAIHQGAKEAA